MEYEARLCLIHPGILCFFVGVPSVPSFPLSRRQHRSRRPTRRGSASTPANLAAVFQALDLDTRSTADPLDLLDLHTKQESGTDKFVNDLEPPAFTCLPDLKALKERLVDYGFDVVSMSGSGTSLFCMGEPDPAKIANWPADLVDDKSLPWPVRVFKTEFINRPADEWYPALK